MEGTQEIIEFPTLVYNIEQDKVDATFHEYVAPVLKPVLTPFCTELTGITQEVVDRAQSFPLVWESFQEFLARHNFIEDPNSCAFVACGDWDLRTMLPKQLAASGYDVRTGLASPLDRWINIKKSFQSFYSTPRSPGLSGMLKILDMELEGRHHSGIDDCKNILRIVRRMRSDGWHPGPSTDI